MSATLPVAALRAEHWRRHVAGLAPHRRLAALDDATLAARLAALPGGDDARDARAVAGASANAPQLAPVAWFGPTDDRRDPWLDPDLAPAARRHAERTCYLIGTAAIATRSAGRLRLHHATYGEYHSLCRDDPFWDQPVALERLDGAPTDFGYTGYLLDAQTVLTCWHGWEHFSARAQVAVFGYARRDAHGDPLERPVAHVLPVAAQPASDPGPAATGTSGIATPRGGSARDWVLLRLEHPVTHLGALAPPPLALPRAGRAVYTLGHPCGLPLKLADGARVLAVEGATFRADLDTFTGNSGSPAFDAATHALVGLVLEGQKDEGDFEPVPARGCYVARQVGRHLVGQSGVTTAAFAAAVTR